MDVRSQELVTIVSMCVCACVRACVYVRACVRAGFGSGFVSVQRRLSIYLSSVSQRT